MDYDDQDPGLKRLAEAMRMLIRAYELIGDLLEKLPLAIMIPRFEGPDDWDAATALPAVIQARRAAGDEPVSRELRFSVDRMLLDWLTGYEMGCMADIGGPAPWRTDAMIAAAIRAASALSTAAHLLELEAGGQ